MLADSSLGGVSTGLVLLVHEDASARIKEAPLWTRFPRSYISNIVELHAEFLCCSPATIFIINDYRTFGAFVSVNFSFHVFSVGDLRLSCFVFCTSNDWVGRSCLMTRFLSTFGGRFGIFFDPPAIVSVPSETPICVHEVTMALFPVHAQLHSDAIAWIYTMVCLAVKLRSGPVPPCHPAFFAHIAIHRSPSLDRCSAVTSIVPILRVGALCFFFVVVEGMAFPGVRGAVICRAPVLVSPMSPGVVADNSCLVGDLTAVGLLVSGALSSRCKAAVAGELAATTERNAVLLSPRVSVCVPRIRTVAQEWCPQAFSFANGGLNKK